MFNFKNLHILFESLLENLELLGVFCCDFLWKSVVFQNSQWVFHGFLQAKQVEALEILHQLHKTTLQLSVRSFSAAISACARSGQWQQSLELLNQMEGAKLAANIITYNAAISACEKCFLSSKLRIWIPFSPLGG